jgi:secernin
MHDSPAGFTWGNTATSLVVEVDPGGEKPPGIWLAYLPPCTSLYLGICWPARVPDLIGSAGSAGLEVRSPVDVPRDAFQGSSLWWRLHRIVEAVRRDPLHRAAEARRLFRPLERDNLDRFDSLRRDGVAAPEAERFTEGQLHGVVDALQKLEGRWGLS